MNTLTRADLIGYLLGALDASEHAQVEQHVRQQPELKEQLDGLRQRLRVLDEPSLAEHDPPIGLARRTCEFVARARRDPAFRVPLREAPSPRRARPWDLVLATVSLLLAWALFSPPSWNVRARTTSRLAHDASRRPPGGLVPRGNARGSRLPSDSPGMSPSGLAGQSTLPSQWIGSRSPWLFGDGASQEPGYFRGPIERVGWGSPLDRSASRSFSAYSLGDLSELTSEIGGYRPAGNAAFVLQASRFSLTVTGDLRGARAIDRQRWGLAADAEPDGSITDLRLDSGPLPGASPAVQAD